MISCVLIAYGKPAIMNDSPSNQLSSQNQPDRFQESLDALRRLQNAMAIGTVMEEAQLTLLLARLDPYHRDTLFSNEHARQEIQRIAGDNASSFYSGRCVSNPLLVLFTNKGDGIFRQIAIMLLPKNGVQIGRGIAMILTELGITLGTNTTIRGCAEHDPHAEVSVQRFGLIAQPSLHTEDNAISS